MVFQKTIKVSDVPASGVAKAVVGTHELAIVKLGEGYYALDGICTHEGGPLGEGTIEGDELVCPWHEGKYKIETGEADPDTDWVRDTRTFPTKVEGGYLWVDL